MYLELLSLKWKILPPAGRKGKHSPPRPTPWAAQAPPYPGAHHLKHLLTAMITITRLVGESHLWLAGCWAARGSFSLITPNTLSSTSEPGGKLWHTLDGKAGNKYSVHRCCHCVRHFEICIWVQDGLICVGYLAIYMYYDIILWILKIITSLCQ